MKIETVSVNDGKYQVSIYSNGRIKALRYGEEWRDCTGDNLIYWLAVELQNERNKMVSVLRIMAQNGHFHSLFWKL